jgi:hypothetical protein
MRVHHLNVDQVCSWLLQHTAGSRESCRITATKRHTCSNRNQFINSVASWTRPLWRRLSLCRRHLETLEMFIRLVFTWPGYIPGICHLYGNVWRMPGIYQVYLSHDIVSHTSMTVYTGYIPGIQQMSYWMYIPSIYVSYDMWILRVYAWYIPGIYHAIWKWEMQQKMQWHTGFGLQGSLMFSTERGGATGHSSARASPDHIGRRLQSHSTDVLGGVAPPPPTPTAAEAGTSHRCQRRSGRR